MRKMTASFVFVFLALGVAWIAMARAESPTTCSQRVAEYSAWVKALMRDERRGLLDTVGFLASDEKLVRLSPQAAADRVIDAPVIVISKGLIVVEGNPVAVDSQPESEVVTKVLERVAARAKMVAKYTKQPPPRRINLAVSPLASWSLVTEAIHGAVRAGYLDIFFLFYPGSAREAKKPRPSSVSRELERIRSSTDDPQKKQDDLAKIVSQTIVACPGLQKIFRAVAHDLYSEKRRSLLKNSIEGVRSCGCKVDIPAFKNIIWSLFNVDQPVVSVHVSAAQSPVKDAETFKMPRATPWSIAHKKLLKKAAVLVNRPILFVSD